MLSFRKVAIVAGTLVLGPLGMAMDAGDSTGGARRARWARSNKKFVELHLKMDTPGIMAMWAEDGVNLVQAEAPMVGRKTIAAWVENVQANMPGYKVTKEEKAFHDMQVRETGRPSIQVAQAPEGNPNLEGYGKMALVLHRQAGGGWKIRAGNVECLAETLK
jgi:ketosteroid isomerase-like protein